MVMVVMTSARLFVVPDMEQQRMAVALRTEISSGFLQFICVCHRHYSSVASFRPAAAKATVRHALLSFTRHSAKNCELCSVLLRSGRGTGCIR